MTLSPARTFRAALWRVSNADAVQTSVPNCKTGLAGDSLFHANGANNGRMRQRDRAFDGGAWSTRAVRGRRARMNRGTERSGKPWGSIEAHTFACCPPDNLPSRSSRHSIVTFHPQVQQSTSIPTHKPEPAFISNRTAARTTP